MTQRIIPQAEEIHVLFCRSLFVLLSLIFWPLYCLSFFDLQPPITIGIFQNINIANDIILKVMLNNHTVLNAKDILLKIQYEKPYLFHNFVCLSWVQIRSYKHKHVYPEYWRIFVDNCVIHFYIHWYLYIQNIKVSKHIYYSGWVIEWVSEWLLFNANSAMFQLYHGENKLTFNKMMMRYALY
jgi:hypothetical protein